MELRLGPPARPLPKGWSVGLTREQREIVLDIETSGSPRVCDQSHPRGYTVIYLGSFHPYARRNGLQTLHRWLMMRHLGRVLKPWEHVHHKPDVPKDTTDVSGMEVLQDVYHGQLHYGTHFVRSSLGTLIWVGCTLKKGHYTEEELQ